MLLVDSFLLSVNIHWLPTSEADHPGPRKGHDSDLTIDAKNSIPWISRHRESIHGDELNGTDYAYLEANAGPRKIHACT